MHLPLREKRRCIPTDQREKRDQSGQSTQVESRLLALMAISNQAAHEIDQEVDRTAMGRTLNLRNVPELVDDGFRDSSFA